MPGRMTDAFRAKVLGVKDPPLVPVVQVTWPTGTGKYSSEPFQGYDQRIAEAGIGNVATVVSEEPSDVTNQSVEIVLLDLDGAMMRLLYGRRNPRRSRVVVSWAHPELAEADWFPIFTGVLDSWNVGQGRATLNCKTDTFSLNGYCPKTSLMVGTIPGLNVLSRGVYPPIVYGIHDDQSLEGVGALSCVPVDAPTGTGTANHYWIVSLGVLKAVARVRHNGGSVLSSPSNYEVKYPVWGGSVYTAIYLKDANAYDDTVTCDVEGLTDVGDGSGAVILHPCSQIEHFLSNFGWGDWKSGTWYSSSLWPIDLTSFTAAATFLSRFGSEGSLYIGGSTEQVRALDVFNLWLTSNPMLRGRWSNVGTLGVVPISHESGEYLSEPWIQQERDELRPMTYEALSENIVARVSVQYLPGHRAGKLWQALDVQDLQAWEQERSTAQLPLECSAARFQ